MAANQQDRRAIPASMTLSSWPATDGWPLRRFDWEPEPGVPVRGSMLIQGGRGDFIEKYLESHHHWYALGWRLTGFDWRGQGGSGRFLADPAIGHAASLDPLLADLAAFVEAWRETTPGPHVILGHSMGGHLTLRLLAEHRPVIDAAVLVAPMLDFASAPVPARLARLIARVACMIGLSERSAWKQGDRPDMLARQRQTNLTSSLERYEDEQYWKMTHPEIAVGPPSWGWLAASARSMKRLARAGVLEDVRTPVLLLGATHDRLVSAQAIRRAATRLPDARLKMFDDGAHELLREADPIRHRVEAAIDGFLDERAPRS